MVFNCLIFQSKHILWVLKRTVSTDLDGNSFQSNSLSIVVLFLEIETFLLINKPKHLFVIIPGRVAQSVTYLASDACLTADTGVASSIPARYHTFVEIDHEIISTVILLLPLIYSRRVVVSYKRKYVHKLLVNRLLKPAQEKVWLSELTVLQ